MKFYVYKHGNEKYAFVPEHSLEHFAASEFKPQYTTFTGAMVEAESPDEAFKAYTTPTLEGTMYYMVDEPDATAIKTRLADTKAKVLNDLAKEHQTLKLEIQGETLVLKLREINILIQQLARDLYEAKPHIFNSVDHAYMEIRDTMLTNCLQLWRNK